MTARRTPSLAAQLQDAIGAEGPEPCKLCLAMKQMNAVDRSALETALTKTKSGRHAVSVPTLYRILNDAGYSIPRSHVRVHRLEHCE